MKVWSAIGIAITGVLVFVALVIDPEPTSRTAVSKPQAGSAAICPHSRQPDGTLASRRRPVSIPVGEGSEAMDGLVSAPKPRERYSGKRPIVVIGHSSSGDRCDLIWLARYLAGRGYVVVTYSGAPANEPTPLSRGIGRMRDAVDFAAGPQNPFRRAADQDTIGVAGFSFGATVASVVQSDPDRDIDAAVALENLRRWREGDPGLANGQCAGPPDGEIDAVAPALGMASEATCRRAPRAAGAAVKQAGFLHWRDAGVASMELVPKGFGLTDFGGRGTRRQRELVAYFATAWFDRWLLGRKSAEDELLADEILERPVGDQLSSRFSSGAFLPGRIDSTDLP